MDSTHQRYNINMSSDWAEDIVPITMYDQRHRRVTRAVSPNMKNFMNVNDTLGYPHLVKNSMTHQTVTQDMHEHIQQQHITLHVIGYGGFMANMLYFLSQEIQEEIFDYIYIYEPDQLTMMNSIRMYKDLSLCKAPSAAKLHMITQEDEQQLGNMSLNGNYFNRDMIREDGNNLYIGSPDFETRQLLEDENFLFFGHSGSETIIHHSPKVDAELAVETYGKMNIREFHQGVFDSTQDFIRILTNPQRMESNTRISTIDQEHNTHSYTPKIAQRFKSKDFEEVYF